jgi:ATP-dependent helicase/nuclease subunit B
MTLGRIQLVLGRTGAGKSRWIRSQIQAELAQSPLGSKLFWVVPDALSYATERHLLQAVPTAIRAEVVHMYRLAERAHAEMAKGPQHPVNTTGRRLLLSHVFRESRAHLQVLFKDQPSVAFLDAVLEAFDELSAAGVRVEQLQALLDDADAALSESGEGFALTTSTMMGKLQDLSLLYLRWQEALAAANLYNPANLYDIVRPYLPSWSDLQGAKLYIDGYSDLTASELAFVLDLAAVAEETVITLCVDPAWIQELDGKGLRTARAGAIDAQLCTLMDILSTLDRPEAVFAPQTVRLYQRIVEACAERNLPMSEPVLLHSPKNTMPRGLELLEERIFGPRQVLQETGSGIGLAAAQNIHVEADGVARELLRFHNEQNVPYERMTVLVPDGELYFPYLREAFRRHGIPVALDDFPSLANHPLAKFLLAAVQCVEEAFSLSAVLRLLKTDFCQLSEDDADWLETYIRQYEVEGEHVWLQDEPWDFAWQNRESDAVEESVRRDDARADCLRRCMMEYMHPLWNDLESEACPPRAFAAALWNLLQRVDAKKAVAEWMVGEDAERSPLEASLHEQAWQKIMGLLGDLWETLPETPVNRSFLLQVVKSDIIGQRMTSIPAGLGQVLVSDYRRAQGFFADIVFVMGAADGALPRRWRASGLWTDDERTQFCQLVGQRLGDTAEERQLAERFTVYTTLTRARRRLFLTYPLADAQGKEIRPAALVQSVREMFAAGLEEDALWTEQGEGLISDWKWWTESSALDRLLDDLRDGTESRLQPTHRATMYRWFTQNDQRRKRLRKALAGVVHKTGAPPLSSATARALYGTPLRLNVYQLESFFACPFQHFAKYGLRLQEDVAPDVTAAARGTILHDALDLFLDRLRQDVDAWRALADDEAVAVMHSVFEEVLASPKAALWGRKALRRFQASEVWSVLERAAVVLTRHARYGLFTPAAMEVSFGVGEGSDLPGFEVSLDNGVTVVLRGRIDRIDAVKTESGHVFRIVDYKSSALDIDLSSVEYGMQLQLPVYAAVVERHSEALFGERSTPGGLIYIPILRKMTLRRAPLDNDAAREESLKQMRTRGFMVHQSHVVESMDTRLAKGEASDLFKQVYKKDGSLMKTAPALPPEDWQRLLETAMQRVQEAAHQISQGNISVAPYMLSPQDTACRFCAYSRLCHIDRRWDASPYRRLARLSKDEVLHRWREAAAVHEGGEER